MRKLSQIELKEKIIQANMLVKEGARYRHSKSSGEYEVLYTALDEATEEPVIVYRALYGHKLIWVRSLKSFTAVDQIDGKKVPKFIKISDGKK